MNNGELYVLILDLHSVAKNQSHCKFVYLMIVSLFATVRNDESFLTAYLNFLLFIVAYSDDVHRRRVIYKWLIPRPFYLTADSIIFIVVRFPDFVLGAWTRIPTLDRHTIIVK